MIFFCDKKTVTSSSREHDFQFAIWYLVGPDPARLGPFNGQLKTILLIEQNQVIVGREKIEAQYQFNTTGWAD